MPFYDYHCKFCGHDENDVKRIITENVNVMKCPECGKEMKQVIRNFNFDLKGSGWAKDGYSSTPRKSTTDN